MLKILPVCDLLGKNFIVPAYQRGYRWEKEQITAFLDDLYEFNKQKDNDFYCLQPIVVVPSGENSFIVVDGQQRLTTIHILLNYIYSCFKEYLENLNFTLEFVSRPGQKEFMKIENLSDDLSDAYLANIDYFYLKNAWNTIKNWYISNNRFSETTKTWEMLTTKDKKHVTVLWNEITDTDAVNAFRRLNYGKIQLESAEIVKALLLQSDCYHDQEKMSALATRRAVEWDKCEKDLADPYFAGMLGLTDVDDFSKIDVVLDFVADEINKGFRQPFVRKTNQLLDLFNYHVINKYLNDAPDRATAVSEIWKKIQKTYNQIANWHKNRNWHHLIGLYSLLYNRTGVELLKTLISITDKSGNNKEVFVDTLRKAIGAKIQVPDHDLGKKPYAKEMQGLNCPDLKYDGAYDRILRNILIAFNVWLIMNSSDDNRRFPFHLFRKLKPLTLEHIHPQSLEEDIHLEHATCSQWLDSIKKLKAKNSEEVASEKLEKGIIELEKLLADPEDFNEENVKKTIKKIELEINAQASITEAELHSITNLALLDAATNSSLKNNLMDDKRKILMQTAKAGNWLPPGTEDVFAKKYSAGAIKNMDLWLPEDRARYQEQLEAAYNYFIR